MRLVKRLIQRNGIGQHTRTGIWDFEHFQQGWNLGFAGIAPQSFGNVEADIGRACFSA